MTTLASTDLDAESAFALEQGRLRRCWTFLGLTSEIARDNDWFTASLGGRPVFVQRTGDEIVGFESAGPRRLFSLRTAGRGNGPIASGLHQLTPIEIGVTGSLIFGRCAGSGSADSLEQFLGDGGPILAAITTNTGALQKLGRTVASNWRLLMSITLDDYHVVAIHGNLNHIRTEELAYHRFGAHSALMMDRQSTLPSVAAVCRANSYQPTGYQIFNLFPNLAVSLFDAQPYWYAQIQQFVPVSASQTQWRSWIFPADFDAPRESAFQRFIRPVSELIRAPIVRYRVERIARQDHAACEQLQTTARQAVGRRPILGAQEMRVAWFDEAYEEAMAGGPRPH